MSKLNRVLAQFALISCVPWFWSFATCAQERHQGNASPGSSDAIQLNWIYGAYVPKNVTLSPLNESQRVTLYLRQTFTTPGIYVKTGLFSIGDQITNSPPEWDIGVGGFARRFGSRYGQFVIQNSFVSLGNGLLGYEPRYDRCHCFGLWPRTKHALLRNFVTYNQSETAMRFQSASYGAAVAAGAISSFWKPHSNAWAEGYRGALTQAGFGMVANWLGEFAPEVARVVHRHKANNPQK